MAEKQSLDPQVVNKALEHFLQTKQDGPSVHHVQQRLELHITGTTAYIPSYTRQVMDEHHGAPVVAVHTRTDPQSKKVFIYPADNPDDKAARKLRTDESMGPAYFAFGVPLRTLRLKLTETRRLVLPLNALELPDDGGTVYWAAFADIEKEARNIDKEAALSAKRAAAATKQAKAEQARTRRSRTKTATAKAENPPPETFQPPT